MGKRRESSPRRHRASVATTRTGLSRWVALALVAAAILVYSNSLRGPFVFDDRGTIIDNPTIEDLWSPRVLAAPHETPTAGRPVVNLSFAVNYAFGGRDVTGYHLVNIAIHTLCALVVFGISRRSQPSEGLAFAIALLWGVHPLNSEAVNYITQRTESLMAFFYLLTLYCAIRARPESASRGRWEAAAIVACALGMASKETMVTAPLAIALYDRAFLFGSFRGAFRIRWRLYVGLAATWGILTALVLSAPRDLSAGFSAHDANAWTYLLNQAVMIKRYLWLALWPRDLVLFYGWPVPVTLVDVLPSALLALALLAITALALWHRPPLGFLGAWCFLTLAPTTSVIPIATEVGAERRMYLALIALVSLVAVAIHHVVRPGRARASVLAAATLLLGTGTLARNTEYRSSLRLAETSVERWPTAGSHGMLGTELAAAGRLQEAERHLRDAVPHYPPAEYYLGTVLAAQDRRAEAVQHFETFIAGQPSALDQVILARALLAENLSRLGRDDEAVAQYRVMLAQRPDDEQAMVQLGQIFLRQQRHEEAINWLRQAVAAQPGDVKALNSLGIALASTGRLDEAIAAFQQALDRDAENVAAQQNLARALALRAGRSDR